MLRAFPPFDESLIKSKVKDTVDTFGDDHKCMHKQCSECKGSGTKKNGEICVHMISCPCPKCNPQW